jgi:hypothetical protein
MFCCFSNAIPCGYLVWENRQLLCRSYPSPTHQTTLLHEFSFETTKDCSGDRQIVAHVIWVSIEHFVHPTTSREPGRVVWVRVKATP